MPPIELTPLQVSIFNHMKNGTLKRYLEKKPEIPKVHKTQYKDAEILKMLEKKVPVNQIKENLHVSYQRIKRLRDGGVNN